MTKKWDALDILRHARHDWLNRLQLIQGNLALDHVDRAKEIIDEIVIQSKQEAKLSNLNAPELGEFLLTFNWCRHPFQLDFEIIGDQADLSNEQQELLLVLETFVQGIEDQFEKYEEQHLLITIQLLNNEKRLILDYDGKLKNREGISQMIRELDLIHISFDENETVAEEEELVLSFSIK
ncbi:Spo0B C-terminal domain-containing protein [Pseudalkalibacillus caeni]|uniref:Sporulation protein n=1 Tax=Exobacillus caeni TaxID=2574798 RepID=A0A5R9F690_9BACL|nr:Spo0B C-terminal domain-containing protein [Pseudalkalibacillus caeni]TLS39252.1 sporulation protein [Pseudalkalibacillus caeni]